MDLRVGQTYRLLSGEVVTIVELPTRVGRDLRAFSHDAGVARAYAPFAFHQTGVELLEVRSAPAVEDRLRLRALVEEVVRDVLSESKKRARR